MRCVNGAAMQWIDCLTVDIEVLFCPAAFPGLNELAMLIIYSSAAESNKIGYCSRLNKIIVKAVPKFWEIIHKDCGTCQSCK